MKKKTNLTFKSLSPRQKLQFVWDYYKFTIAIILIVIYIIGYIIYRKYTYKEPDIYVGIINTVIGSNLEKELTDKSDMEVYTYENLMLTENSKSNDISYFVASQTKILGSIEAQRLDIIIANEDAMAAFAQNGYLANIEDYLADSDLAASLSSYYVKNVDLSTEEIKEYPVALELTGCSDVFKDAGFADPVYLCVIANSERKAEVIDYITHLTK